MREIKFRVWDRERKKWVYFTLQEIVNINHESLVEDEWAFIQLERVGQYTGLKDKNGKEIYEGDIVRFTRKNVFNAKGLIIGVIEYHPDRLAYIVSNCIVRQPDGEKEKWDYTFLSEDGLEVIGNIYDNPELLED